MPISITIQTTTSQIKDSNGVDGFGSITVTPSQAFTYYDGASTISVSANSTTVTVSDGKLDSSLTLAPNTGASQSPSTTYYIVDLDLNGTLRRELWQLAATPTTLEFTEVSRYDPNVNTTSSSANPYRQYVLRSDTLDSPAVGAASDGRGYIPRADTTTGKLDSSWLGGSGGGGALTAADIPIVDAGGIITATEVEGALQENRTLINSNTSSLVNAVQNIDGGGVVTDNDDSSYVATTSWNERLHITLPGTGTYLVIASAQINFFSSVAALIDCRVRFSADAGSTFTPSSSEFQLSADISTSGNVREVCSFVRTIVVTGAGPTYGLGVDVKESVSSGTDSITFSNMDVVAIKVA